VNTIETHFNEATIYKSRMSKVVIINQFENNTNKWLLKTQTPQQKF